MSFASICVIQLVKGEYCIFQLNTDPNPANKLKFPNPRQRSNTSDNIVYLNCKVVIFLIFDWFLLVWF